MRRYQQEYGFTLSRPIVVDDIRVRCIGRGPSVSAHRLPARPEGGSPSPYSVTRCYFTNTAEAASSMGSSSQESPDTLTVTAHAAAASQGSWFEVCVGSVCQWCARSSHESVAPLDACSAGSRVVHVYIMDAVLCAIELFARAYARVFVGACWMAHECRRTCICCHLWGLAIALWALPSSLTPHQPS
jgi:hypothetical protein